MPANLENSAVTNWKGQFSFQSQRKAKPKNTQTTTQLHSSHIMLKILQASLQQYVNHELPDVQDGFRKDRGTKDQIASINWIIEKARKTSTSRCFRSRKTSTSALLTMLKLLTVWITTNCGKFLKKWEYRTILPAS